MPRDEIPGVEGVLLTQGCGLQMFSVNKECGCEMLVVDNGLRSTTGCNLQRVPEGLADEISVKEEQNEM